MTGKTNLWELMASMTPRLLPGIFVYCTIPSGAVFPEGLQPVMLFREDEGTTLIIEKSDSIRANLPHIFPSRMITHGRRMRYWRW